MSKCFLHPQKIVSVSQLQSVHNLTEFWTGFIWTFSKPRKSNVNRGPSVCKIIPEGCVCVLCTEPHLRVSLQPASSLCFVLNKSTGCEL